MTPKHPALKAIIKTDFLAFVGALTPPIGILLTAVASAGLLPNRNRSLIEGRLEFIPAAGMLPVALAIAVSIVAGTVLLAWRTARIRAAFASGRRVPGRITGLRRFKDRAYVHYAYEVDGQRIETFHFVHQTAAFRRLDGMQEIVVAFDPRAPRAGFVATLFEP